jgi:hypothetical protein
MMIVVNVERLTGLSIEALYTLAEKMGLDLPPGLEKIFVVEAILEAFEEDSQDRKSSGETATHIEEKKYCGSELDGIDASIDAAPCISNHYNETAIHMIPRDPEWAFVFWDIRDHDLDGICGVSEHAGLFLKVNLNPDVDGQVQDSFDVPVGNDDDHWYLQLPEPDMAYRVDLYARCGSKHVLLARSNCIHTPRAFMSDNLEDMDEMAAELAVLSGLDRILPRQMPERHPSRILGGFVD